MLCGFRAMARTILDEVLGFRPDFIEYPLAHAVRDSNRRADNRKAFLAERRRMMRIWADYLDRSGEESEAAVMAFTSDQIVGPRAFSNNCGPD